MSGFYRESAFSSILTENIVPISIKLPLTKHSISQVSLPSVPLERINQTLSQVLTLQNSWSYASMWKALVQVFLWLFLAYFCILVIALSLLNVVLIFIGFGVLIRFGAWSVGRVKIVNSKANMKKIKKWLEKENREFYSRKLIRWVYDADHG